MLRLEITYVYVPRARYDLLNHLRNIEEENAGSEGSSSDDSMECEKVSEYDDALKPLLWN